MSFHTSLSITVLTMGIVMLINTLVTLAVSFITLISLNAVIVRIYLEMAGDSDVTTDIAVPDSGIIARIRQIPVTAWCGLGVLVLTVAFGAAWLQLRHIDLTTDVLVIAHRGSSLAAPENTMAAINLAIEESSDYVEIDVQEDSDGKIVVLHDADLKRVAGVNKAIADTSQQDARDIDIGSWFDDSFSAERLPLLKNEIYSKRLPPSKKRNLS
jgi:glycerophosphoryl diester phosphodiesterase